MGSLSWWLRSKGCREFYTWGSSFPPSSPQCHSPFLKSPSEVSSSLPWSAPSLFEVFQVWPSWLWWLRVFVFESPATGNASGMQEMLDRCFLNEWMHEGMNGQSRPVFRWVLVSAMAVGGRELLSVLPWERLKVKAGGRWWLDGITDSMDMNLNKLRETVEAEEPGGLQSTGSQRVGHDSATERQQKKC